MYKAKLKMFEKQKLCHFGVSYLQVNGNRKLFHSFNFSHKN